MKIILSGGGTLGPVVPLLAVREAILKKYPEAQFVWVGTKNGPEREIIEKTGLSSVTPTQVGAKSGMPFFVIGAGKWRRYVSLWNAVDIFKMIIGFFQSLLLLLYQKPDLLISAGGYISVPLHWAGALLGIPSWVHQQDVRIGFANRLMFPLAKKVTTALEPTIVEMHSRRRLPRKKTKWIGNPCRDLTPPSPSQGEGANVSRQRFNIQADVPVIFALGGGTGSASINQLVAEAIPHWPREWHIIHLVGRERPKELAMHAAESLPNYHVYEFFTDEMKEVYAIADIVIARAGFATLSELAALSKAAIILPMYGTHQEDNARWFAEHGGIIILEKAVNGLKLAQVVKDLIASPERRLELGQKLHELLPLAKSEKIIQVAEELMASR